VEYRRQIFSAGRMLARRRDLRQKSTNAEEMLWTQLRRNGLGYKFKRQFSIENYVLDFYCPEFKLAVEVDGEVHNARRAYDEYRTRTLKAYGVVEIRFSNVEVIKNLGKVVGYIKGYLTSPISLS
jgi:very-short-patch-repair endonuclease